MEVHIEKRQDKSVIVLDKNKILGTEAAVIQNTLMDLIQHGNKNISVDLSKVDYITSWGIGILIHAHTSCLNRNIDFQLTGVNADVLKILKKVKLDTIFSIQS